MDQNAIQTLREKYKIAPVISPKVNTGVQAKLDFLNSSEPTPPREGFAGVADKRRAEKRAIEGDYASGKIGLPTAFLQSTGNVIGGAFDIAAELPIIKQGIQLFGSAVESLSKTAPVEKGGEALAPVTGKIDEWYQALTPEQKRSVNSVVNILSVLPVEKAAQVGLKTIGSATKTGTEAVMKGAGKIATEGLGMSTGAGASSMREAFVSAKEGGAALDDLTKAMRGELSPTELLQSTEDIVSTIKKNRGTEYAGRLKQLGEDKTTHNIKPIQDELNGQLDNFGIKVNEDGTLDFSRSSIANSGTSRADVQGVYNTLKDWGTKPGDRTGVGLDTLKKQLDDFYSESSKARSFVQAVKSSVLDILNNDVKGYKEMTTKYSEASNLLDEIKSATGVGSKSKPDTVFTKLTTAMKRDNEFRIQVLKEMERVDPTLMNKIAGTNLQEWLPQGLVGKFADWGGVLGILAGHLNPTLIPLFLSTSPRIAGEVMRAAGMATNSISQVVGALKRIPEAARESLKGVNLQE